MDIKWFGLFIVAMIAYTKVYAADPVAGADIVRGIPGVPVTMSFKQLLSNDSDADGDQLYLITMDDSEGGSLSADHNAGLVTFHPVDNTVTEGSFIYSVADVAGSNDWGRMGFARVTIDFSGIASDEFTTPVSSDDFFVAQAGVPLTVSIADMFSNDYSPDGEALYLSYFDDWSGGTLQWDNERGVFTFTPEQGFASGRFTYGVSDGEQSDDPEQWGFGVVHFTSEGSQPGGPQEPEPGIGEPPFANDDTVTVSADNGFSIPFSLLFANDGDPEGESIFIVYVDDSINGQHQLDKENSRIIFTPEAGFTQGSFIYGVSDSELVHDVARMGFAVVTVNFSDTSNENQLPVAAADTFAIVDGAALTIPFEQIFANDQDPENDALYLFHVDDWMGGVVTRNDTDRTLLFTPNSDFSGTAQFSYWVTDIVDAQDFNRTSMATVSITVSGGSINQLPVAVTDSIDAEHGEIKNIPFAQLLNNDTDAENDPLHFVSFDGGVNGTPSLASDGQSIDFMPDPGFHGVASFSYSITDAAVDEDRIVQGEVLIIYPSDPTVPVREANTSCIAPQPIGEPEGTRWEMPFPSLPMIPFGVAMVQPKNDSSFWWYVTRFGQVYHFDNRTDVDEASLALDLSSEVLTSGEFGLTGMAVHPDYPSDNRVFLLYNTAPTEADYAGRSLIASFEVDVSTKNIDLASKVELFTLHQPEVFHNGGDLAFGLDGMLYAAFGDSERDQEAQDLGNVLGAMIRIDINTIPYAVPTNNPYYEPTLSLCSAATLSRTDNCPEIFAHGFRNPWRFSIDALTGEVWVGDVGDAQIEEVDRVVAGGNYGWPDFEGSRCNREDCSGLNHLAPITEYGRDQGVSVVGGYVYRGTESPALVGQYIFGDVFGGELFSVPATAPELTTPTILTNGLGAWSLAQGNDGEVYALLPTPETLGDAVRRLTATGGVSVTMPEKLSDTGCFDTTNKSSAPGVFDYAVNSALWSDGETKIRSFALLDDTHIDVLPDGDYQFPEGSILIKHFLEDEQFIETRLFVNHSTGWAGYSYEWNEEQGDAQLLDSSKVVDINGREHLFPSASQCTACHTSAANLSLGLEHKQLNSIHPDSGLNMIDHLSIAGYFNESQNSVDHDALVEIDNVFASITERARSYLHSNCSGCHRPGGPFGDIDFRYSTSFSQMNICDVAPSKGDMGIAGAARLAPGNPAASILLQRMKTLDTTLRMPPLASSVEHVEATQLLSDWIAQVTVCN